MIEYYNMMFKRKSFRQFKSNQSLSETELQQIEDFITSKTVDITKDVSLQYKIVPSHETSCKRGEYCVLIYGKHDNISLLSIGYVFAQLDFFLSSKEIGSCWYGMGKPCDTSPYDDLPFVIMLAIGKASPEEFRKNYKNATRKANEDIAIGQLNPSFLEYVKYSPSACNSQPWLICKTDNGISIRIKYKEKMIIPKDKISFYNTIDMGIMMLSCELWFQKNSIGYTREVSDQSEPFQNDEEVVKYGVEM